MLRNLAAALALILMSQTALGLGLGTLKQSSALNEPFDGRIEILGVTANDLEAIRVRLADASQFERAGIERSSALLHLRFKVVDNAAGSDYVQIISREPIREPFLNFLLELNWANGRMVREYTVLLDPPLYDPARRRVTPPPVVAAPASAPKPAPSAVPAPSVAPVVTLAPIAPMVSTPAVEPISPSSYSADAALRPVETNDTLWSIARANRPDDSTSVQQMMLALLRANPEAFGDNNINILKRGSILRLPEDGEINAMSRVDAIVEVKRQHQLWNEYRDVAIGSVADAPLGDQPSIDDEPMAEDDPKEDSEPMTDTDTDPSEDIESMAESDAVDDSAPLDDTEPSIAADTEVTAETDARLELVAPGDGYDMGAGADEDGGADITLAREELDAQVQENNKLQARIAEANEIIALMSRQVDIKDDELAALQARLSELGIEATMAEIDGNAPTEGEIDALLDDEPMFDDGADVALDTAGTGDEVPTAADDVDITFGDDSQAVSADPLVVDAEQGIDKPDIAMDEGGGTQPDTVGSMLGGLILQHITNMVPGGAMTILGILGVVLLGAIAALFKMIGSRKDADDDALGADASTGDDDPTALTEGIGEDDEPITESRETESEEFSDQDTTEVAIDPVATTPEMEQTLQTSAEELVAPVEPEEDLLEEVNVYLAYERFDQAEELVRKVIGDHPGEHKYKLRLLEVFYSSNNQVAYEEAARALHESVGESDSMWESTVAMWTEMSPDRALFAEGAASAEAAPASEQQPQQVVDITAEDEAGASTADSGVIDFDISDTVAGDGEMFDITAPSDTDGAPLDFDIGDLDDAPSATDSDDDLTLDISGGLDFDSTLSEADGDSLELDIAPEGSLDGPDSVDTVEMEAIALPIDDISDDISEVDDLEFDLSLQSSDLDDLAISGDTVNSPEAPGSESDSESEIEFDLALEDTIEMDSLVIDDTMELPKTNSSDESLEDLAKSMEESIADFDLSLADTSGGLDLDLSEADGGSATETSLDFDLGDLDIENVDPADTIAMDLSGGLEATPDDQQTVVLPVDGDVDQQSEADEIDTKLNLAKAYIELGDNDGARSILDEVARDGSDTQQTEAQRLIEQLT